MGTFQIDPRDSTQISELERNHSVARVIRARLEDAGVVALDLLTPPGAGTTALLEYTLEALGGEITTHVIAADARPPGAAPRAPRYTERVVGMSATLGDRRLDAHRVAAALDRIPLRDTQLLFVENPRDVAGPVRGDVGEDAKVVVFPVTEPEDTPLRRPTPFRRASLALIHKVDLLPRDDFDLHRALGNMRDVNPNLDFLCTSVVTGEGMDEWLEFLRRHVRRYALPGRAWTS